MYGAVDVVNWLRGRRRSPQPSLAAVLTDEASSLVEDWRRRCREHPSLPTEVRLPLGPAVVAAMAEEVERGGPAGRGLDLPHAETVELFVLAVGSPDVAVGQLLCLRPVLERRVSELVPHHARNDARRAVQLAIDRSVTTAVQRVVARLEQQAFVDHLTGLLNRRALDRDLTTEIGRASRYGRRVAVVVIDLDGLKSINDRDGHAAGDRALRSLANALEEALRLGDLAYRVGGDEFVLLLPEITADQVKVVLHRVMASGVPRFSWGVATYPDDAEDPGRLLELADDRLYARREARPAGPGSGQGGAHGKASEEERSEERPGLPPAGLTGRRRRPKAGPAKPLGTPRR